MNNSSTAIAGRPPARTKLSVPDKSRPRKNHQRNGDTEIWNLRLYVAGQTPKSISAFANLKQICEQYLLGRYRIEVVDLLVKPQLARGDQIVAVPTLVRRLPEPLKKIIGDLSNTERTLIGLDLQPDME